MSSTTVYLQQAVLVAIQTVALRRRWTHTISSRLRQLRTDTRLEITRSHRGVNKRTTKKAKTDKMATGGGVV